MIVKMQEVEETMAVVRGVRRATKPLVLIAVGDRHLHWLTRLVSIQHFFSAHILWRKKQLVHKLKFVCCAWKQARIAAVTMIPDNSKWKLNQLQEWCSVTMWKRPSHSALSKVLKDRAGWIQKAHLASGTKNLNRARTRK